MKEPEKRAIITAAEELQARTSDLILAIDNIEEENERKELRRSYAELIAFIEERFVFRLSR